MDILVPFSIRKKQLTGAVSDEAKKLFAKLKEKPEIATAITAKGLPDHTTPAQSLCDDPGRASSVAFLSPHIQARSEQSHPPPERLVLVY